MCVKELKEVMSKSFEILAMNVMKVLKSIEENKTSRRVSGSNCKCGHRDEIQASKSKIFSLENKISELEID